MVKRPIDSKSSYRGKLWNWQPCSGIVLKGLANFKLNEWTICFMTPCHLTTDRFALHVSRVTSHRHSHRFWIAIVKNKVHCDSDLTFCLSDFPSATHNPNTPILWFRLPVSNSVLSLWFSLCHPHPSHCMFACIQVCISVLRLCLSRPSKLPRSRQGLGQGVPAQTNLNEHY